MLTFEFKSLCKKFFSRFYEFLKLPVDKQALLKFVKSIIPQTIIISHWPFKFAVFGTIEAHPSQGQRFARYDQANSTHTNMTHDEFGNIGEFKFPAIIDDSTSGDLSDATSGEGSGEQDNLFNNTIHLLDFLSQLIINQDPNNQNNTGCETWMTKKNLSFNLWMLFVRGASS
jgi:hypothetical protein